MDIKVESFRGVFEAFSFAISAPAGQDTQATNI